MKIAAILLILIMTIFFCCTISRAEPLRLYGATLCYGDSFTYGEGTSRRNSYPAALARLTGSRVFNGGSSGETTATGLRRLKWILRRYVPDTVIILEGGNDFMQKLPRSATKANIREMIEACERLDVRVVLIGVPAKQLPSDPLYEELANEYGLIFEGTLVDDLLSRPDLKSDNIHLNRRGYRELATGIYELIKGAKR